LLLLTITLYPGGIGQQLLPLRRWLAGGPLVTSRHEALRLAGLPAAVVLVGTAAFLEGDLAGRLGPGAVAGVTAGVLMALVLLEYVRRLGRRQARVAGAAPDVVPPAPSIPETARQPAGGAVR
ncbi:MAG TPA: hypothetical protein VE962_00295, partial [Actinomycetota bacterium]|nr:hypothetical protein [Actinomycetota bacterium]